MKKLNKSKINKYLNANFGFSGFEKNLVFFLRKMIFVDNFFLKLQFSTESKSHDF